MESQAKSWVRVASLGEVREHEGKSVKVGDVRVALFRIGSEIFALEDRCSHIRAPLSSGFLEGRAVACPLHDALFDLRSGQALRGPAHRPVCTFETKIDGKEIFLKV